MAYSAQADLAVRLSASELIALADVNEDGVADANVITEAIEAADAEIDTYLRERQLDVPISPVPESVKQASISLAIYYLHLWRRSITEDVQRGRDNTINWLRDVSKGKATLGYDDDHSAAEPQTEAAYTTQERKFKREDMEEW
jgi:phage gp36-like protein